MRILCEVFAIVIEQNEENSENDANDMHLPRKPSVKLPEGRLRGRIGGGPPIGCAAQAYCGPRRVRLRRAIAGAAAVLPARAIGGAPEK